MPPNPSHLGLSTLLNHLNLESDPPYPHLAPIYQTSVFRFPDVSTGREIISGQQPGYYYTRLANPNLAQLARKIAALEGLELLPAYPERAIDEIVAGRVFASGMAAISAVIMARAKAGDTLVVQENLYGNTYNLLAEIAPRLGLNVVWVRDTSSDGWGAVFQAHPEAVLAYVETPANPTMWVVDLAIVAELAHQYGAWLVVDNTFATPYCQRPLSLGADVVVHSTTKYLSGHGAIIGGAAASPHIDFVAGELQRVLKLVGSVLSPFDAWLTDLGLRTFELRMQRHCENAMQIARFLEAHPKVAAVHYPGLESHPGHEIARRQMHAFGGMMAFELNGGYQAGEALLERVRVATLAVSLGNVDTLIQHPASMTHFDVPREERLKIGLTDGLVRLSVGIENVEDLIEDLEQGLG
jgi:methionine-gamma-lyase